MTKGKKTRNGKYVFGNESGVYDMFQDFKSTVMDATEYVDEYGEDQNIYELVLIGKVVPGNPRFEPVE